MSFDYLSFSRDVKMLEDTEIEPLSTEDFVDFHDNMDNYKEFKEVFSEIYEIFDNAGFAQDADIDMTYSELSDADKIRVTTLINKALGDSDMPAEPEAMTEAAKTATVFIQLTYSRTGDSIDLFSVDLDNGYFKSELAKQFGIEDESKLMIDGFDDYSIPAEIEIEE